MFGWDQNLAHSLTFPSLPHLPLPPSPHLLPLIFASLTFPSPSSPSLPSSPFFLPIPIPPSFHLQVCPFNSHQVSKTMVFSRRLDNLYSSLLGCTERGGGSVSTARYIPKICQMASGGGIFWPGEEMPDGADPMI